MYFFLALVLFSRTRLNLLRSGWVWEKVPIRQGVGARWITYTVLMLASAVIIALLLPTQYSLGLLGTLGVILELIVAAIQLIIFAFATLLYALLSLFTPDIQPPERPAPPTVRQLQFPQAANAPPLGLSEFAQSLIFWTVFLNHRRVRGGAISAAASRSGGMAEASAGMSVLVRAWHKLRDWFGGLNQQIEEFARGAPSRAASHHRSTSVPRRWVNPRKLSPRQQVQFYYLAMLRRGGEHGHARQRRRRPTNMLARWKAKFPKSIKTWTASPRSSSKRATRITTFPRTRGRGAALLGAHQAGVA